MKMRSVLIAALSISLMCASAVFSSDTLYVQPLRAKIYAHASFTSEVLGTVSSGYTFESTGKQKGWLKLIYNGKQGFLPAAQTASYPPVGRGNVSSGGVTSPKLAVRARTSSSYAVVAGIKGLTYEDRARLNKGDRFDYEALEKVEALKISSDELAAFILEGEKP